MTGCPQEPENVPPKSNKTIDIAYDGSARVFTFDRDYDLNTFNFTGLGGRSVVLVKSNASNYLANAASTGKASGARSLVDSRDGAFASPAAPRAPAVPAPGAPVRIDHVPLPRTEAAGGTSARGLRDSARRLASETGAVTFQVGSTRNFWIENETGTEYVEIPAVLRAIGTHCYIWVPDSWFSATEISGDAGSWNRNDNTLNGAQCAELARVFDGAYPLVTNVLGYENGGGPTGDGGVDGDNKIHIFAYDIGYDWFEADPEGNPQSSGVYGYFDSQDLMDYSDSNRCEMFYIDAHFTDQFPGAMYSTLVHEFQHMIHTESKTGSTPSWFNEMLSMLAEDFMQDHLKTIVESNAGSAYNIDDAGPIGGRIPTFNGFYDESGVMDWLPDNNETEGNETLFSYSSAYAFGAYLARNYGGIKLVSEMEKNGSVGMQSVTDALHAAGFPGESFATVFARYGEALVYNAETAETSGMRHFDVQDGPTEFPEGSRLWYNFSAFNIHEIVNVNGYSLMRKGPSVWNLKPWTLRPWGLSLLSAQAWSHVADSVSITLEKPENPAVQLQLMVVREHD